MKKIYEYTIEELEKKSKIYRFVFYSYVGAAIFIGFINGIFGLQSLNNVMAMEGESLLLGLCLVLISINTLLIIFLWFINETNYYKMMQLSMDMMVYFKKKEVKKYEK